jgi:hypothetical protein
MRHPPLVSSAGEFARLTTRLPKHELDDADDRGAGRRSLTYPRWFSRIGAGNEARSRWPAGAPQERKRRRALFFVDRFPPASSCTVHFAAKETGNPNAACNLRGRRSTRVGSWSRVRPPGSGGICDHPHRTRKTGTAADVAVRLTAANSQFDASTCRSKSALRRPRVARHGTTARRNRRSPRSIRAGAGVANAADHWC